MASSDKLFANDETEFTDRVESEAFGPQEQKALEHLNSRVIGQERAARGIANGLSLYYAGLNDPTKPIGAYFFSGPTGWGKTYMAEETARFLIGDAAKAPLIRIPCAKFKESHRLSELLGAPPSYVGYDRPARLSQQVIDEPHFMLKVDSQLREAYESKSGKKSVDDIAVDLYEKNKPYFSVILFDEVEKAHTAVHDALLHIVDDGELSMPDGSTTSFANSVIILTCNVGGREQQDMLSGKSSKIGFGQHGGGSELTDDEAEALDQDIYRRTLEQIEKMFAPELIGRLKEDIVVFRTLSRLQQKTILEKMLFDLQIELSGKNDSRGIPVALRFGEPFKEFLLDRGINRKYGIRPLKRTVRKFVRLPLGKAISSGGIVAGDEVLFKVENEKTVIFRKKRSVRPDKALMLPPKR